MLDIHRKYILYFLSPNVLLPFVARDIGVGSRWGADIGRRWGASSIWSGDGNSLCEFESSSPLAPVVRSLETRPAKKRTQKIFPTVDLHTPIGPDGSEVPGGFIVISSTFPESLLLHLQLALFHLQPLHFSHLYQEELYAPT